MRGSCRYKERNCGFSKRIWPGNIGVNDGWEHGWVSKCTKKPYFRQIHRHKALNNDRELNSIIEVVGACVTEPADLQSAKAWERIQLETR